MQILETPETERPKRSMSYNDLKKKRLIRSSKSTKKINNGEYYFSTVKKRPISEVKSIISGLPQDEKVIQNCILQLKGVLGQIRKKSQKKRTLTIRQNLTERPSLKNSLIICQNKQRPVWNKIIDTDNTKQLIKSLLSKNKNKSQRRLVKFTQIRDNFKKQKERSLSQDKIPVKQIKIRQIPSPLKNQTKNKYLKPFCQQNDFANKNTKVHIKLSEAVKLGDYKIQENPSEIKLDKVEKQINEGGKQNQQNANKQLIINDISSIINIQEKVKENQSTFNILQCINTKQSSQIQGSFLKLMNETQLNNHLKQSKESRRRCQLQKIKRIFPKGFFDN